MHGGDNKKNVFALSLSPWPMALGVYGTLFNRRLYMHQSNAFHEMHWSMTASGRATFCSAYRHRSQEEMRIRPWHHQHKNTEKFLSCSVIVCIYLVFTQTQRFLICYLWAANCTFLSSSIVIPNAHPTALYLLSPNHEIIPFDLIFFFYFYLSGLWRRRRRRRRRRRKRRRRLRIQRSSHT